MELTGVGSGILIALAAVLWLVYLVPSWLRRREFEATERNAIRLQQTLRILAETAELPEPVQAEATARAVAERERLMRIERRRREQAIKAITRQERVRTPMSARRKRGIASLVLLGGILGLAAGVVIVAVGSPIVGWVLAAVAFATVSGAVGTLGRLAPAPARRPARAAAPVARRVTLPSGPVVPAAAVPAPVAQEESREWTPVPVPKPRYLERRVAASVAVPTQPVAQEPAVDARAELARAAAESEALLRAAQDAVPAIRTDSRFAAMGRLDDVDLGGTDIDEALARRRAV